MKTVWNKDIRDQMNHTLAFYLYIENIPENTKLEIAASNVYRLFINGELTGYGPARAAHGYTRIDSYDLGSISKDGLHIVVEVFAANINSYYIVNELPFFGAEISSGGGIMASAEDFKAFLINDRVTKVQRYSFQRTFTESYIMDTCRTAFYLGDLLVFPEINVDPVSSNKLIDRTAPYPRLERMDYVKKIESGSVGWDPGSKLWQERSFLDIGDELLGYKYDDLEDHLSDTACRFKYTPLERIGSGKKIKANTYRTYSFGRAITGFFDLKLDVIAPSVIYILWDEILSEEGNARKDICFYRNTTCNVIKYDLAPGRYDLLSFEPTSAQFVKVIVTEGEVDLEDFYMVTYENGASRTEISSTGDKELDSIVEAAYNSFSQNAVDVLTDCPSRERAGWLCDSYFTGRSERFFTGGNLAEKSLLENFFLSPQLPQLPDGMVPMCYPADHYNGVYIPNWSMWYVLELYRYFKETGDRELILKSRDKVYGLVDFFRNYLNEDGLLEDLESWVFIEWSKCNDKDHIDGVNYPSNMLYAAMLETVASLYDDKTLLEQSESVKEKIVEQSFNGSFFEDNRVRENGDLVLKGHLTETCQYYAFYFGIASIEKFPELFNTLVKSFGPKRDDSKVFPDIARSNAIVGNYLRLEILLKHGYMDLVLDESKSFFTKMAGTTGTLWEHSFESGSLNHGFASVAAKYIHEAVSCSFS